MSIEHDKPSHVSSPPCMAHELTETAHGFMIVDAQTASDVARWRRAQRMTLIEERLKLSPAQRREVAVRLSGHLDTFFTSVERGAIVAVYWPIRGEPNLRGWMQRAVSRGLQVVLPVVVSREQPLVFREWFPGCKMRAGNWQIPVPASGDTLVPDYLIVPLVGFDAHGYRLGHGAGCYDRTLAHLLASQHPPFCIGVGYAASRLATIYPQPHDIPMQRIMTEGDHDAAPALG